MEISKKSLVHTCVPPAATELSLATKKASIPLQTNERTERWNTSLLISFPFSPNFWRKMFEVQLHTHTNGLKTAEIVRQLQNKHSKHAWHIATFLCLYNNIYCFRFLLWNSFSCLMELTVPKSIRTQNRKLLHSRSVSVLWLFTKRQILNRSLCGCERKVIQMNKRYCVIHFVCDFCTVLIPFLIVALMRASYRKRCNNNSKIVGECLMILLWNELLPFSKISTHLGFSDIFR